MEPVTTAALISGGSMLAQQGLNAATANVRSKKQYKWTKKLSDYTYSKDLESWNRQNEYNLPINQMQRLDEAGLNPNLMYGTGQGANVAKEMPKYNAPSVNYDLQPVNMMQILSAFQDIKVKQAQADNIAEQTKTRKLENDVKVSTLSDMINTIKNQAVSSEVKANLDRIQEYVEYEFQGINDGEVGFDQKMRGTEKRLGELKMTQEGARRTSAEADLKQMEAEIYKMLKGIGAGSDIVQGIVNMFRAFILKK